MARLTSLSIFAAFLAAVGWLGNTLYKAELRNPLIYRWFGLDPGENAAWLSTETDLPCSKLEVIWARGSLEPAPLGFLLGPRFKQEVEKRFSASEDAVFIGLDYPAIPSESSIDYGKDSLTERISRRSKQCPEMSFALAGYSQGADVIRYTISDLAPYAERIKSITVFGDPVTSIGYPPYYAKRVLSICNPLDRGCGGTAILGHFGYGSKANHLLTVSAAEWVEEKTGDEMAGKGKKSFAALPPKGEGGQFLLPWAPWPPVNWHKDFIDGEPVQVIGVIGVDSMDQIWGRYADPVGEDTSSGKEEL